MEGKCKKSQLGFYFRDDFGDLQIVPVTWQWFKCQVNQKCIHLDHKCDFKPHPACIYYNKKKGKVIAEDEDQEDCLEAYKKKGLIDKSANLVCDSPIHNRDTAAILSTVFNWTTKRDQENTIIEKGTTVEIQAVKCNGISECWNGVDELIDCGFSTFETMIFGNKCFFP